MLPHVEDQMKKLAALTGVMLLAAAETLAQDRTPRPQRRVIVSLPDRKLAVVEDGRVLATFDIAVGATASPTPTGAFTVINHVANPTWYYKGKIVGPGPANPVGTRWMGISTPGYGIHGTNQPASIGKSASHGCIRLRNSDIEHLFNLIAIGDAVELHAERTAEIAALFPTVLAAAAHAETGDN